MRESVFQARVIKDLKWLFRDCVIIKNDPNYLQGIPDLLVLYKDKWAMLECKATALSDYQPNQAYYIDLLNGMSFAAFIYPGNKEAVFNELQQAFGHGGEALLLESEQVSLDQLF